MFSRKSSSHNLLFQKTISRAVSYPRISTFHESDEEDDYYSQSSSQGAYASASAPVISKPLDINDDENQPAGGLRWFKAMSHRHKLILIILCIANFSATVFYSCIAPFYPSYAAAKGTSDTEIGLIFGCFQLVIFFMSPVWGFWCSRIGAKFLFVTGIMSCGVAAILMGFLEFCPGGQIFVIMCFAIRVVDACGVSAFMTASFTIIASEFPHAISTVFGACETFNGLGYTLGPPIGGFLYQIGGFYMPFAVLGGLVCVCGICSWLMFPTFETDNGPYEHPSYRRYLAIPGVWVSLISVFAATLGLGFLDAMYGPHLEEFGISPAFVGAIFLLPSVLYFICAPFLGVLIDRKGHALNFMIAGALVSSGCYLFMGPAPFLLLNGKLWVLIIANIFLGLGTCGQLIPPFGKNLESAINAGFPETFDTHGLVSGALSSATALGAFVGPAVGGIVVENYGFSWTVTGIAFFQLLVAATTMMFYLHDGRKNAERKRVVFYADGDTIDENSPLII